GSASRASSHWPVAWAWASPWSLRMRSRSVPPGGAGSASAWRRISSSCMVSGLGVARQPARDALPVALVAAHVFGVVVEDALAQPGQNHVGLTVADAAADREPQLAQFGQGLLAGPGPGL